MTLTRSNALLFEKMQVVLRISLLWKDHKF